MLDKGTSRSTLKLANVYYEECFFIEIKEEEKIQNSQRGFYENIGRGNSFNTGIASDNVIPYH